MDKKEHNNNVLWVTSPCRRIDIESGHQLTTQNSQFLEKTNSKTISN